MPLYFAYGANMSVDAMARRCPRSKALGPARLERHRLQVMREGWLTATPDPRSAVHGVLWDLALSDVAALDRYEGVPQGLYARPPSRSSRRAGRGRRSSISAPTQGPESRARITSLKCWRQRAPGLFQPTRSKPWRGSGWRPSIAGNSQHDRRQGMGQSD